VVRYSCSEQAHILYHEIDLVVVLSIPTEYVGNTQCGVTQVNMSRAPCLQHAALELPHTSRGGGFPAPFLACELVNTHSPPKLARLQ
jgi:hypothetical protein